MFAVTAGSDPLAVLAAAVTPVVLVSATAILISGVNSRYIAIADRMRALTHEFREPGCTPVRRGMIAREMVGFLRRIRLVSWAERALYTSVACFVVVAMIISATSWRQTLIGATLPFFVLGIGLVLAAIVCQLLELQLSNQTIAIEVSDIADEKPKEAEPKK